MALPLLFKFHPVIFTGCKLAQYNACRCIEWGEDEAKTWFNDVCKINYWVRCLKGQHQYIVVRLFAQEVTLSAMFSFWKSKNLRYAKHLCNNLRKCGCYGYGPFRKCCWMMATPNILGFSLFFIGILKLIWAIGKERKYKIFRLWKFSYPGEASPEEKNSPARRGSNHCREAGFDLQAQRNFAKGGGLGEWNSRNNQNERIAKFKECSSHFQFWQSPDLKNMPNSPKRWRGRFWNLISTKQWILDSFVLHPKDNLMLKFSSGFPYKSRFVFPLRPAYSGQRSAT